MGSHNTSSSTEWLSEHWGHCSVILQSALGQKEEDLGWEEEDLGWEEEAPSEAVGEWREAASNQ